MPRNKATFYRRPLRHKINGALLRDFRMKHNMSMQELADMLGTSLYAVWSWESGDTFPHKNHQVKLEKLLGQNIELDTGK